jgi:hypothetical protein
MGDETRYPRFSEEEFSRRYQAVRAAMAEVDLAALTYSSKPLGCVLCQRQAVSRIVSRPY